MVGYYVVSAARRHMYKARLGPNTLNEQIPQRKMWFYKRTARAMSAYGPDFQRRFCRITACAAHSTRYYDRLPRICVVHKQTRRNSYTSIT